MFNSQVNRRTVDFLGVSANANQDQLNKAYRKKSKLLHPDKVKRAFIANGAKDEAKKGKNHASSGPSQRQVDAAFRGAQERSARLNIVASILRGPGRDRYDHFLKNGFPKWKGTGYYYSRFRPGLGSVLVGLLLVFGGVAHYAALVLGWKRQREFIDRYIRQARRAAWGNESAIDSIPGLDGGCSATAAGESDSAVSVNRRQKRLMDKESKKESNNRKTGKVSNTTAGERKRVVAENGKVLIVDSNGDVFLEQEGEDGERLEFLLDIDELQRPTIRDTLLFRLPGWCFRRVFGFLSSRSKEEEEEPSSVDEGPNGQTNGHESNGQANGSTSSGPKANRGKKKGKRSQKS